MRTAIMKLADINPATYNPRERLKTGDKEYEDLKNSLERFGTVVPLIYNTTTNTLVSGHQRLNILKANGVEETEVVVIEADEDSEKLLNIALNKIDGDWDYEKLRDLFAEMSEDDISFTGFEPNEIENLFDDINSESVELEFDEDKEKEIEPTPEKKENSTAFNVFISFPTREAAENWLAERGIEGKYEGTSRNITIRMDGTEYGKGN